MTYCYFHSSDAIHISFKSKCETKAKKARLGDSYPSIMAKKSRKDHVCIVTLKNFGVTGSKFSTISI